jgi:UDP-N-acetyl-D-mannosaminuronate dehydrogenase
MRAVEVGYDVVGLEVDKSRVDRLAAGDSYVEDSHHGADPAARRQP